MGWERTLNGKFATARRRWVAQQSEVFHLVCNRGDCICTSFSHPCSLKYANKRHHTQSAGRRKHLHCPVSERRILRLDSRNRRVSNAIHIYKPDAQSACSGGHAAPGRARSAGDSIEIDQWIAERVNNRA